MVAADVGGRVLDDVVVGGAALREGLIGAERGNGQAVKNDAGEGAGRPARVLERELELDAVVGQPNLVGEDRREDVRVGDEEAVVALDLVGAEAGEGGRGVRDVRPVEDEAPRKLVVFAHLVVDAELPLLVRVDDLRGEREGAELDARPIPGRGVAAGVAGRG